MVRHGSPSTDGADHDDTISYLMHDVLLSLCDALLDSKVQCLLDLILLNAMFIYHYVVDRMNMLIICFTPDLSKQKQTILEFTSY